jgi:hypothetical protein
MANPGMAQIPPPEVILPSQYFIATPADLTPSQRLHLAILEDALECAINLSASRRAVRLRSEARYWIFSDSATALVAFDEVCGALNINPGYLRAGLNRRIGAARSGATLPRVSYRQNTRTRDVITVRHRSKVNGRAIRTADLALG